MEPAILPPLPGPPSPPGELVVQNGRLSGARRALSDPLTLIGQATACDVRVSAEGVAALHCAVFLDPAGPVLRDLGSEAGTRVNGQRITAAHRLVNGDLIEVGPCQFTYQGTQATAEVPAAGVFLDERERQALRIQAAAVVAQQAALGEEEARLDQRAGALTRQEEQLAGHLEQRLGQLDERESAVQSERLAFAAEADAQRKALGAERGELERQKRESAAEREKLGNERERLKELREGLQKRFQRDWSAKESALAKREAELASGLEKLHRERAQVKAFQERVNGERELGRRQIREEWQELALAQQQWEATLNAERAEQERQKRELQILSAEASAAREALLAQQREAEEQRARLQREAEGLEARIAHQRRRLEAVERELAQRTSAPVPASSDPIIPPAASPQPAPLPEDLVKAAEELTDQRARLAEQWERFLQVQQAWEQDRLAVVASLEADVNALEQRDRMVKQAEHEAAATRASLARQQEVVAHLRAAVEGEQARLTVEKAEWVASRDATLADLDVRDRALRARGEHLEEVHRRRTERRQQEAAEAAEARSRTEEARRQYSALWQDCERLREELTRQERSLASRGLALERYREELVRLAPDSAQAEGRIAKLERAELGRTEEEAGRLEEQRKVLLAERRSLDELAARLRRQEDALAESLKHWEHAQVSREADLAAEREAEAAREGEVRRLRAQQAIDARQLRQLRDELERIARSLMEEGAVPAAA